ncbi:protein kinase [Mycobacterium sp. Soil538]|nr:protein kinase [Mycobacterium sp. Soil538]
MLSPGDRFEGRYVVEAVIGRGGSSSVYRACDTRPPERTVALKVLSDRAHGDVARLDREFAVARTVAHPHVVEVFDHGPRWLTMEYLAGGPVTNLATIPNRLAALTQIAEALDHIHGRGVVHCDVKPANIQLRQDFYAGGAVLVDFGTAHTPDQKPRPHTTEVTASLPYSPPELLTGGPVSGATDEYALACTVVEMVAGAPPFTAATPMGLTAAQLRSAPPRLSRRIDWLPGAFDSVMAKALAKRPADRYQSCAELMALITRILRD